MSDHPPIPSTLIEQLRALRDRAPNEAFGPMNEAIEIARDYIEQQPTPDSSLGELIGLLEPIAEQDWHGKWRIHKALAILRQHYEGRPAVENKPLELQTRDEQLAYIRQHQAVQPQDKWDKFPHVVIDRTTGQIVGHYDDAFQAKAAIKALGTIVPVSAETVQPDSLAYEISLANSDKVALVDHVDSGLETWAWSLDSHGYPRRRTTEDWVYMHTDIMGEKEGFLPDHKDRNPLNNRRNNLRWLTRGQNVVNSSKAVNQKATSKYKGVSWDKERNKWIASICYNGNKMNLGRFDQEAAAAIAYNNAAIKHFGEAAFLNIVSDGDMAGGVEPTTHSGQVDNLPPNQTKI